jgi:hypothetical protein
MMNNTEGYDRRAFLRTLAGGTGTIVTGGLIASCDTNPTELHNHTATSASTVDRALLASGPSPLRIPPVVSANGLVLNAAPGTADLGGGRSTAAWLFNNEFPAPTIVADSGSVASLQFVNGLPQSSIVHWHGILAPSHSDGHPHAAVAPGGTFTYPPFNIAQRAGLCWYHPHPHGLTGEQVYRGLAGAFIVRDNEEAALNLPSGEFEVPLIIRDASFDSSGNLTFTNKSSGFLGTVPLVNGTLAPILSVKAAIYRFRILNGCNTRVLNLGLTNSKRFQVIGNDGGLLRSTRELTRIEMAPAGGSARARCRQSRETPLRERALESGDVPQHRRAGRNRCDSTGAFAHWSIGDAPAHARIHVRWNDAHQWANVRYRSRGLPGAVRRAGAVAFHDRRQRPAPGSRARCDVSGESPYRRPRPRLSVGERVERHGSARGRGDGRRSYPLHRAPRSLRHALPPARARGCRDDVEFRSGVTAVRREGRTQLADLSGNAPHGLLRIPCVVPVHPDRPGAAAELSWAK